jgi:hypothetical protein
MSVPSWSRSALTVFRAFHSRSISDQAATSCFHRERPDVVSTRGANRRVTSRRFLLVVETVNLMCPKDRSTDHLNARSYLLLRCQPMPGRNGFLQCGAISLNAGSIVEGRGLPRVNIDFVIVARRQRQRPVIRLRGQHLFIARPSFGITAIKPPARHRCRYKAVLQCPPRPAERSRFL